MARWRFWRLTVSAAWLGAYGAASAQIAQPSEQVRQASADQTTRAAVAASGAESEEQAALPAPSHLAANKAEALFDQAEAYRLGRGVPADPARAAALYRQAAAQGHVAAASSYAIGLYAAGSEAKAMPLLEAAAQGGDARARYLVGLAHFNGDWLPRDWPRAYALMALAARAGLPTAQAALERIAAHLDPEQKEEGWALAGILSEQAAAAPPMRAEIMPVVRALEAEGTAQSENGLAAQEPSGTEELPKLALQRSAISKVTLRLGAFANAGNAQDLHRRLRGEPLLAGREIAVQPAGRLMLVTASGFDHLESARATCRDLRAQGYECLVAP